MRKVFVVLLFANAALFLYLFFVSGYHNVEPSHGLTSQAKSLGVSRLSLLDEIHARAERPAAPQNDMEPKKGEGFCLLVGNFSDKKEADIFVNRVAALDVLSSYYPVEVAAGEGFWVYLPSFASWEVARRKLTELHARGVDSYIIPRGEFANGISLGVYSKRDMALLRQKELLALGVEPIIHAIERTYREHWVLVHEGEEAKIGAEVWRNIERDYFSIKKKQNLCLPVDSSKKIH